MKKTLLAIAIPAALFANAVNAVELYNQDGNSFSVGGHVAAGITGSDEGKTEVNSVSPRINFEAKRDLGDGFVAHAKAEWSINFLDGGANALSTRLGYVGVSHDTYGTADVGTQWAPYYDVAGVADMPIAFANDFLYADHGNLGTARADKMVSYRNSFEFGEDSSLSFGLGGQGSHAGDASSPQTTQYGARYQAGATLAMFGATLGYAYNTGSVDVPTGDKDATTQALSASYGSYGSGLYLAAVFAQNKNVLDTSYESDNVYAKTNNYEALVAYAFDNSLNISLNYEMAKDEAGSDGKLASQSAIQAEYNFAPQVIGYVGYQVDLGSDLAAHKDNNVWMFGGRILL
ncbi:porin [Psychromonas sp. RZ22]|uniref:porin n=1 Tax=Psychromonas algarum TaxID=2555643 RepID=UPI001068A83E|nr:porin [Psychromonas sp. RZ22]TEW53362.1 porin [Psychromonas sp. RZ22]